MTAGGTRVPHPASGAGAGGRESPRNANQFDFIPTARRNVSPVNVTDPAVPVTVMLSTRPPQSPSPERRFTVRPVYVPMAGQALAIAAVVTVALQVWKGFDATSSPSSGTAGNGSVLAAVQPPDDDENIV